jgi:hypothetical protein
MKKTYVHVALVAVMLFVLSCSKSGSDTGTTNGGNNIDCSGAAKTFAGDANPLIQSVCNQPSCHASGSTNGPGPLTNYSQVFNARIAIRNAVASGFMPRNTTFSAAQKAAIVCWIDNGALNN